MTNITETETKTGQKTNTWTEGILSVLGHPVQVWKESMKHAVQMANENTKPIPNGFLDRLDLDEKDKAILSAYAPLMVLCGGLIGGLIGASIGLMAGTTLETIGGIGGAIAGGGYAASISIGTFKITRERFVTGTIAVAVTIGADFLGFGFNLAAGLGMATFSLISSPRMVAKALYLAPKSVTSILDAAMLGLPSGAEQSMRAVGTSIKSVIIRKPKPKSQPKPVANNNQSQQCTDCIARQQQVSDLTQKVKDLEKEFAQSGAKPKSRRATTSRKRTGSTVKKAPSRAGK